ncbi:MAG TPA: helix-turn-helix domain-containing protein [Dermatophilaceae bacterium]
MSATQRSTRADSSRQCWTAAEVAAILGISKVSVYQALASEALPGCRVGARWLVPMDALDKWLHELGGRSD